MAGFGGGTSRYGGRAGSFRSTRTARNSSPGSFSPSRTAGPVRSGSGGPVRSGSGGPVRSTYSAGPSYSGGPSYAGGGGGIPNIPQLPAPQPVQVSAPRPVGNTSINVTAQRNPQLDALLGEQKQNIQDLKNNTGFAADAAAIRLADTFEGARNAAKYAGGEGNSGVRQTRQDQITDAGLRAQAGQLTDLTLGREAMVTNAIQNQLPTISTQQSGMLGQQGIGLQAEGLRQQANRDYFNQGLAGQEFAVDTQFRNQGLANQAAAQQLAALQAAQGWGQNGWL